MSHRSADSALLEATRSASSLDAWLQDLPWLLLGGMAADLVAKPAFCRSMLAWHLQTLTRSTCPEARCAAVWCLELLRMDDSSPTAASWHLWDILTAFAAEAPGSVDFTRLDQPAGRRPRAFAVTPPQAEASDQEAELPVPIGPRLRAGPHSPVPAHLVATSLFAHVDGTEAKIGRSFANIHEADVIVSLLAEHGQKLAHDKLVQQLLQPWEGLQEELYTIMLDAVGMVQGDKLVFEPWGSRTCTVLP